MATLLKEWGTYFVRSGTSTTTYPYDAYGRIRVYLESQDIANNRSYIRIDHYSVFYAESSSYGEVKNITSSYRANNGGYGGTYQSKTRLSHTNIYNMETREELIGSTYHYVTHNVDGTCQLYVNGSYTGSIRQEYNPDAYITGTKTSSFNIALPQIPRATTITSFTWAKASGAAGLSTLTCSWATAHSIDRIQYSLNGGAYTTASGSGTSGSFSISGLTPNTQYSMKIKVRRADSQVETESSVKSATTYDIAKITSAIDFNDSQKPKFNFTNPSGSRVDVFIGYYDGTGIWKNNIPNTGSYEFNLTQAEWDILYDFNKNHSKFTILYRLRTISGNNYDSDITKQMTIINANPTFTTWTYADTNATILALTGSNQKIVKGYSNVKATITSANKMVAIKGATATSYQLTIGEKNATANYSPSSTVEMTINAVDNNVFNCYAIDSRDNSTKVIKTLTTDYINYTPISITSATATRTDDIGTETTLAFSGNIFDGSFGSVSNSVKSATYKFKKTTDVSYTDGTSVITPTKTGSTFSFSGTIKGDEGAGGVNGFDATYSYNIQVIVTDELSTHTFNFILGTGTPNIAISQNGVAINQAYDEILGGALQVNGDVNVSGTICGNYQSTELNRGGAILLKKPPSGTDLTGGAQIDLTQNRIRFFHNGTGYYGSCLPLDNAIHVDNSTILTINSAGTGANVNNFTTSGIYTFYGTNTNSPFNSTIGILTVKKYSYDWLVQIWETVEAKPKTWKRAYYGGTSWSNWVNYTPRQTLIGSSLGVAIPSGATRYVGSYSATDAYSPGFVMPCAGTLKNLRLYTGGSPGTGQAYYFDLFVNNVQKAIKTSISTVTNIATDLTNEVSVSAGDRVSLRCVSTATATQTGVQYSLEFYPI